MTAEARPIEPKLRVLRLTPFFHHGGVGAWPARYDPVGGQQMQCLAQSSWLAQRGVEQLVLTLGFPGVPDDYIVRPGLRVRRARYPLPEWRSATTGLVGLTPNWSFATRAICRRLARTRSWMPDLVHVHGDGQIEAVRLVPWIRRIFDCPIVLTIHCSRLTNYRPMSWIDALRHSRVRSAERNAVEEADAIVCLNADTQTQIGALVPGARKKLMALADVVDIAAFRSAATSIAARDAQTRFAFKGGRVLAFVGRIAPEKGWRDVVRILSEPEAHDWRAIFVGDGPQRCELEAAIAAAGLEARTRVTGFLAHAAVAGLIAASDAVVVPSVHEEFGGVAIESMALGIPVVGYAVGGLRRTIGMVDRRLLAAPGDHRALFGIVAEVLSRPPWVDDAVARGHLLARDTCDADAVLPRLLALYHELAGTGSRREQVRRLVHAS